MIYPENFEKKIGFKKIKESLKKLCLSSLGENMIDDMCFSSSAKTIERTIKETNEFMLIIQEENNFPTAFYFDVRESLNKIRIEGTFIEIHELFNLKRSMESISAITRFFNGKEEKYPFLIKKSGKIKVYPYILQRLDSILTKHGDIKDNASPELADIRRNILKKQSSISKRMHALMQIAQKEGWADQDTSVSIRDGRMVIPLPSAYKRKINGIVHDESATGKTAYIEPAEIVETNNDIRELEYAEKREITKILITFSNDIRPYIDDIIPAYEFLAFIDFVRAKALYSISIKAILPNFEDKAIFHWEKAVHPLLFLSNSQEDKTVVPLNIFLNDNNRIILISGPNAGGKSVCLQTLGLLQYMFQSGMPVPVGDNSIMGIFDDIFIDIGDEQSIENDLSTYSSHLVNMKKFVKHCKDKSLILIDEFGTGTEPMLGAVIAEAILNKLNNKKAKGVITTHYTNLKHFASSTEGITNGAMLYDSHNMLPLFELQIGKPGSSFAFEIARKIGLPKDILDDASSKIGEEHIDFDKHLREIVRDKKYWENKRKKIHDNEKKLNTVLEKYNQELADASKLRKKIMEEAKREAQEIIANANKTIERTIREIKNSQAEKKKTKEARDRFEQTRKQITSLNTEEDKRIQQKIEKLKSREEKNNKSKRENSIDEATPKKQINTSPTKGDMVLISGTDTIGEVLEINGKNVTIALGNLITIKPIKELKVVSKKTAKKHKQENTNFITSKQIQENISTRKLHYKPEIDVRGHRGDEALQLVQDFIDESIMVEAKEVRILHGTGHGILRQLIRDLLKTIPLVKSYRDEKIQMGGTGITVVTLDV